MISNIHIIDDFYQNPDEVVEFAQSQEWRNAAGGNHFLRTVGFPAIDLIPTLEDIIGEKVNNEKGNYWWTSFNDFENFNCSFYKLVHSDDHAQPNWIHHDWTSWAGVIYLDKECPTSCGTSLWRHIPTGQDQTLWRTGDATDGQTFDPLTSESKDNWEQTDTIANKYNRLVLFRGSMYHSVNVPLGPQKYERLNQLLYFDTTERS